MSQPPNSLKIENWKLKIIYMGTPEFSVPILEVLARGGYQIISVVTKPDPPPLGNKSLISNREAQFSKGGGPVGRKQVITSPPVKVLAQKFGIPVLQPEKLKDDNFVNQIKNLAPDLIVVAAYGKIIPKVILDIPKYGAINVHGSLLPAWRGAAPIQYAILNGDKETGVTIMLMDEEMDHGALISKSQIPISKNDTYESLSEKLSVLGAKTLIESIPGYISGEIKSEEQDHSKATYTKIIKKEDGRINWSKIALEIERMVRAFYPWPSAYAKVKIQNAKGKITSQNLKLLKILEADVTENSDHQIGETFLFGDVLAVQCGKGALIIKKLQLESGKVLSAREFLNGHKDFIGNIFG